MIGIRNTLINNKSSFASTHNKNKEILFSRASKKAAHRFNDKNKIVCFLSLTKLFVNPKSQTSSFQLLRYQE